MKKLIGLVCLVSLILIIGCATKVTNNEKTEIISDNTPSSGINFYFSLSKDLALGQTGLMEARVTTTADLKDAEIKILLPEGFELLQGSLLWKGDIIISQEEKDKHPLPPTDCSGTECEKLWTEYKYPSAQLNHQVTVKALKEGDWTITAVLNNQLKKYVYIKVSEKGSVILDKPFDQPQPPCKELYINQELIQCTDQCPPGCNLIDESCFCP